MARSPFTSDATAGLRIQFKIESLRLREVERQAERGSSASLSRAAFLVMAAAKSQLQTGRRPSPPGRPPRTKRGQLRRAIRYAVDRRRGEAVIGPAYDMVGTVGAAHEFGGKYRRNVYPERPFMGPALNAVIDQIPRQFRGSIGPTV